MNQFTIIYYTSNRENEEFEKKIRDKLVMMTSRIPIISVSHKPINLGINISVGVQFPCNHNLFRQIQIGAKLATTPFIIFAEADCLYPPDYFRSFTPTDVNQTYKCDNLYILNEWGKGEYSGFYQKETGTFAQISGREHLIKEVDFVLKDRPFWYQPHWTELRSGKSSKNERPLELFRRRRWKTFTTKNPIVSIKTEDGMSKHTRIIEPPIDKIPWWGEANKLRKELFP